MSTKNRIDHLTDDAQRLDNQITQRCAELGITLTELAHRMGVTPQTLHNIRRGAVQPRLQTQVALEDALGWERGGYDTARAGGTPRLKDTTPNAPIPPGIGFRRTHRPDGTTDYWYTVHIRGEDYTLHVADIHNRSPEEIETEMKNAATALRIAAAVTKE